jgi:hypothetical protein
VAVGDVVGVQAHADHEAHERVVERAPVELVAQEKAPRVQAATVRPW